MPHAARPGGHAVAVWATDRAANRLVGLDRDLFVVHEITIRSPVEVEPAPGGGAWVLSAVEGDPLGRHRLVRIAPDGESLAEAHFGVAVDLTCHDGREAVVVEWGLDSGAPDPQQEGAAALPEPLPRPRDPQFPLLGRHRRLLQDARGLGASD